MPVGVDGQAKNESTNSIDKGGAVTEEDEKRDDMVRNWLDNQL